MKRIILTELLLVSLKEKRGKRIQFDKRRTILIGDNKTGKSSIIKSVYSTFGAIPSKIDSVWLGLNVCSCVKFTVNDIPYLVVKNGNNHALFNADHELLLASSKVGEFSKLYSELFDFRLTGTLKSGEPTLLPIQFMIAPFYVDQDDSWTQSWNSFSGLNYIQKGKDLMINFFAGLRPNKYYDTLAEINQLKTTLEELNQQRVITKSILAQVQVEVMSSNFNIDVELFKEEITQLLFECELLKEKQEALKTRLIDLHESRLNKEVQFKLAERSLKESLNDYHYATEIQMEEEIECPTCGAHYDNSILERFELAKDTGTYEDLLGIISEEAMTIKRTIDKASGELNNTTAEVLRIQELLNIKKGELAFRDIIEVQGRNEIRKIFNENIAELNREYNTKAVSIMEKQKLLKSFDKITRKKEIKSFYMLQMTSNLKALGSYVTADKINDLFFQPKQTGSELPRALLAYYFAIFSLIQKQDEISFWPILIDAPYQQEPDQSHIEKTIQFLDQAQPKDTQMIIGVRDLAGQEIDGLRINLDAPLNTLSEEEYDEIYDELQPFFSKMRTQNGLF